MNKGMDVLIDHAIGIAYYMRGAIQYEDILDRTYYERMKMVQFINKRLKIESEKVKQSKGKLNAVY